MPKLTVWNTRGEQVGEMELSDHIFGIEPNLHVMHEAVRLQNASERRGTHSTKNRALVRGGGRKPWKQKGTGRARQGSIRAPQWVGGGTVFGPTPRSYSFKLPKKVRRLAIRSALSAKVRDNECMILDQITMAQPKTKEMNNILRNNLKVEKKALLVSDQVDQNVWLSSRNIPGVKVVTPEGINVRDVLNCDRLILTQGAVAKVEEVLGQ